MTATDAETVTIEAVAAGLEAGATVLSSAKTIEVDLTRRNDRGWPTHLFAAKVGGGGNNEVGVWAIGNGDTGIGPIFAINPIARALSSWGSAANPDSPAINMIELLAGYPEARDVADAAHGD